MLLIKGSPGHKFRADVGAGVASTVATTGPLTASVTAAWRVPSIYYDALLPDSASSAAWRSDSPYPDHRVKEWAARLVLSVAEHLPRDCRYKT